MNWLIMLAYVQVGLWIVGLLDGGLYLAFVSCIGSLCLAIRGRAS